jgi:4-alpha-glucanotransferase
MNRSPNKVLHTVAQLYNVQSTYTNMFGRFIEPPPEAILRVLQLLGAPLEGMEDLDDALRQRRKFLWQRGIASVNIAWDRAPLTLNARFPVRYAAATPHYQIRLENGDLFKGKCQDQLGAPVEGSDIEGTRYVKRRLFIPEKLPLGYHELRLEMSDLSFHSHLFAAPVRAFTNGVSRRWGLFCPLYALGSEKSWGAGDFSDLEALVEFAAQRGGSIVGTLPLLGAFLDQPYEPSPYSPVSRLFWNEFYLDVTKIPELEYCPAAGAIVNSSEFQADVKRLRDAPVIHYRELMALKRRVLEELAHFVLGKSAGGKDSFQRFIANHPAAEDYAAFRAKVEREGKSWTGWPSPSRNGTLSAGDYDDTVKRYHLYVQWQANEQVKALGKKAQANGAALYLDFPLGVNREGYDVWRERGSFAVDASGGAPPDTFFTKGQNWGFPPLHPETIEQDGYRYYIRCLRHHLKHAGMLRIDHVMGLHRLYWIPDGFAATEGVYVRYPAERFYAILGLESHRHQAQIVGENLGTVSPHVNAELARHGIGGMYVGQFGIVPGSASGVENISESNVASVNTHDTPTFAGFWSDADIRDSFELGLISESELPEAQHHRAIQRDTLIAYLKSRRWLGEETPDMAAALKAWLTCMADSDASVLLINLEDLWLEPLPQNVPGTWEERPNWRRKARFSLAEVRELDSVTETLKRINHIRKRKREIANG